MLIVRLCNTHYLKEILFMHEYSIINHPREKVIFYLTIISVFFAQFLADRVYPLIQEYLNIKITFAFSSGIIFCGLYLIFNKYLWKLDVFAKLLNFPDLNGTWKCIGLSRNTETSEEFNWDSTLNISQTWNKILISQQTATSTSQSISNVGCIRHLPGLGFQVSYHYQNEPNAMQRELLEHDGLCTLIFSEDLQTATGNYYNNGKTRKTVGIMNLERVG